MEGKKTKPVASWIHVTLTQRPCLSSFCCSKDRKCPARGQAFNTTISNFSIPAIISSPLCTEGMIYLGSGLCPSPLGYQCQVLPTCEVTLYPLWSALPHRVIQGNEGHFCLYYLWVELWLLQNLPWSVYWSSHCEKKHAQKKGRRLLL